jgi:hypothetical protein
MKVMQVGYHSSFCILQDDQTYPITSPSDFNLIIIDIIHEQSGVNRSEMHSKKLKNCLKLEYMFTLNVCFGVPRPSVKLEAYKLKV